MKYSISNFKGMLPIIGNTKLPFEYATTAINTKLVSGDIEGYLDIGNPFTLAKTAPIISLGKAANGSWLQFNQSELASFAATINVIPGTIPGDITGRRYITGYNAHNSVPQWTNTFYATDPSQRGSAAVGAFPYVTFPLGIADPTVDPAATAPAASGTATTFNFSQETSVNNAVIGAAGTAYRVGDKPYLVGGTYAPGFSQGQAAAQIQVTSIDSNGGITGMILLNPGNYQINAGPGSTTINQVGLTLPAASITVTSAASAPTSGSFTVMSSAGEQTVNYTGKSSNTFTGCTGGTGSVTNGAAVQPNNATASLTGGSGSGATVTVLCQLNNFNGFGTYTVNNGAGYQIQWGIVNNQWWSEASQGDLTVAYSNSAFGFKTCQTFTIQADMTDSTALSGGDRSDLVLYLPGTYGGQNSIAGPAVIISDVDGTFTLQSTIIGTNGGAVAGTIVNQRTGLTLTPNSQYRVLVTATSQNAATVPGFSVIATLALASSPSSIIATVSGFVPYSGEIFGVGLNVRDAHNNGHDALFENIFVQVSQPANELTVESTNYVYTYVQNIPFDPLIQESGPSDPSATIDIDIDSSTNPPTRSPATIVIQPCPANEYIAYYYLYRLVADLAGNETYTRVTTLAAFGMTSVTGSFSIGEKVTGGTTGATATVLGYSSSILTLSDVSGIFLQGETITGGTSAAHGTYSSSQLSAVTMTYVDTKQDSQIGPAVLISQNWAPPPANMQGIIAGPNGVMYGYAGNILCASEPNYPHAWPVGNQYATDTAITSTTPIDTSNLVTTQSYPYTVWGTDPSALSMSKEVSIQGCVATRGTITHKLLGVVYPSGNGWSFYKGPSKLDLVRITELDRPPFSYEQWQTLTPSSIIAVLHDDYLFWFYNNGTTKSGFVLDLTPNGFGMIQLDFHCTCMYVDPSTDTLYLVPDFSVYPINGSVVSTALNVVSQWEGAATYRPRSWERDDILYKRPVAFQRGRVQSKGSGTINLNAFSGQGTAYNAAVSQQTAFAVAPQTDFRWNAGLSMTGAVAINTLDLTETIEEMVE
jgi:hypothetical protein